MTEPLTADDPPAERCSHSTCGQCAWWRLPLLLALVLAAIVVLNGRGIRVGENAKQPLDVPPAVDGEAGDRTVLLEIDFGDQRERRAQAIAWREGMTVADVLRQAHRPARLETVVQGSGASALLTEIDGVANEGADGSNWTYAVNGERADRSFAVFELEPGDRVLWTFTRSE